MSSFIRETIEDDRRIIYTYNISDNIDYRVFTVHLTRKESFIPGTQRKDGPEEEYDASGNLIYVCDWKKNCRHGTEIHFNRDVIVYRCAWRYGRKHGIEQAYREDDTPIYVKSWNEGLQDGPSQFYYDDGSLCINEAWRDGMRDGLSHCYDRRGNMIERTQWRMDVMVTREVFDENI